MLSCRVNGRSQPRRRQGPAPASTGAGEQGPPCLPLHTDHCLMWRDGRTDTLKQTGRGKHAHEWMNEQMDRYRHTYSVQTHTDTHTPWTLDCHDDLHGRPLPSALSLSFPFPLTSFCLETFLLVCQSVWVCSRPFHFTAKSTDINYFLLDLHHFRSHQSWCMGSRHLAVPQSHSIGLIHLFTSCLGRLSNLPLLFKRQG